MLIVKKEKFINHQHLKCLSFLTFFSFLTNSHFFVAQLLAISQTTNACNRLLPTRFISIFAALINRFKNYIGKCLSVVFNVIKQTKKKEKLSSDYFPKYNFSSK